MSGVRRASPISENGGSCMRKWMSRKGCRKNLAVGSRRFAKMAVVIAVAAGALAVAQAQQRIWSGFYARAS